MARYAQYIIKPELYDLVFPSPDGRYAVKASVYSFLNCGINVSGIDYYNIKLVDCTTDSDVIVLDGFDNNIEVEWSSDSRYAAMSHGQGRYFYMTDVFNVADANFITLPYDEIAVTISNELGISFDNVLFYFNEWSTEDRIKIKMALGSNYIQTVNGWYIYDLVEKEIVDSEFNLDS